ncbi:MAG: hypothetical protein P1Q69_16185, partial [Candidatus Thorarchaeota archaeon]|nr:hypothetical protein [Candidatus Thorarchaeota archaeon]
VGYTASFTITYTDYDHDTPITGQESAIRCNWSDIHVYGDQNYTVTETGEPGVYEVVLFSTDDDALDDYSVVFDIGSFGVQNQTFTVTVNLRTHLTSFYLTNSIAPTPYTGDVAVYVMYYDEDVNIGIENGTTVGSYVFITVESLLLPGGVEFNVLDGTSPGEYIVLIPASQWGSIGTKDITITANYSIAKYTEESISKNIVLTGTPSNIFIDESPLITPYGENITFTVVFYDLANDTGIVNQTSIYGQHVHLTIFVLTAGETITQYDMVVTEVDPAGQPGVYRIEFNTSLLSGVVDLQMRIMMNWTKGQLPLYENQTLLVTASSTYRLTSIDWTPIPVTPYDELVNLTVVFRDFLTGNPILNGSGMTISIQEAISYTVIYEGDANGKFQIELDSSSWSPGTHTFHLDIEWVGTPFYRNSTSTITITVRERYADLIHGSYYPTQYDNTLTIKFTYRDLDDFTSVGMDGNDLTLDAWLLPFYTVNDNLDGTYTVELKTQAFSSLGTYTINVTITYLGTRYFTDASDLFYLEIIKRKTQLTSELPQLAPYQTLASINVTYSDDNNGTGIENANVYITSTNITVEVLELGENYWVSPQGQGIYLITIKTESLGSFGRYVIVVTVNWTADTKPFYIQRVRTVDIEVSRRPTTLTVSSSPFNTPFLENFTFQITATDNIDDSGIILTKSVLVLSYGSGTILADSEYVLTGSAGAYTIEINSTLVTDYLIDDLSIVVEMKWGDVEPYYTNATASTEVSITARFTQASVISTPPAYYYFNSTALLRYSDYLTGIGLAGATIDYICLNTSSFTSWVDDLGDGTYNLIVNTISLPSLGRFMFKVNFTTFGEPYHSNLTDLTFSINVNPVSTILTIEFPASVTYYLGDTVVGNITYRAISTGTGIESAAVGTNWGLLFGTYYKITTIGNGVYNFSVETSGLNAGLFVFQINASKYLHLSQEVTVDVLVAAIPAEIVLEYSPTDPSWGEIVLMKANVTDARTGTPIVGADVNMTISGYEFVMADIGGGIYEYPFDTSLIVSGEYEIVVHFSLTNHEDRNRDFQIRIGKISSNLDASLTPFVAVNGQTLSLTANYSQYSNGTEIDSGYITFSWVGGSGILTWDSDSRLYLGSVLVANALVGNQFILVKASSDNFKSVSLQITVEIREVSTNLISHDASNAITSKFNGIINVTVYLNNTDLNSPVDDALVSYGIGELVGNMTFLGNGYYNATIMASELGVGSWTLTAYSSKDGYAPASFEFTVNIERIDTKIVILSDAFQEVYYGQNVTFQFTYFDLGSEIGISNASNSYLLEATGGTLRELGNGNYSLTLNSTIVAAGALPYDISLSFSKDTYLFASTTVRLLVSPIPTRIIGLDSLTLPVGDAYNLVFTYDDIL